MSARERHTLRLHQQVQDKIRSLIEQKKFVCDLVDSYVTEIKSQAEQQLLTEDADQFTEQYVDIMQQLDRCYKTCVLIAASAEDLIECAGSKIPGNQENKGKNEESQRPAFEVKEMSARERHTLRLRQQVQDKIRSLIDQKEFLYDLVDSYFTEAKSQAEHLLLTEDAGQFTDQYVDIMQQLDRCYKTCVLFEASAENLIEGADSKIQGNQENKKTYKEPQRPEYKRPRHEWSQTDNTVCLSLAICECQGDQLKDISVEFTDKSVTLTLPERKWSWILAEEIVKEESRVKVSRKQKVVLQMKKKNELHWSTYEAKQALPSTSRADSPTSVLSTQAVDSSSCADESVISCSLSDTLGSGLVTPVPISLFTCGRKNSHISSIISEPVKSKDNQLPETKMQEEHEPVFVFELQHMKHDFIEKDDTITLHVYVKEINKDTIRVNFEPRVFIIRFQTGDKKFLQMHNMSKDTVFQWKLELRGEIIPERSKYKIASTLVDITLGKKDYTRWGDLAALKKKF